jgi:hypothetical protein
LFAVLLAVVSVLGAEEVKKVEQPAEDLETAETGAFAYAAVAAPVVYQYPQTYYDYPYYRTAYPYAYAPRYYGRSLYY